MLSIAIATGIFVFYFLYKSAWMLKAYLIDKESDEEDKSISRAYGWETFLMLGVCMLVLFLGEKYNY